MTISTEQWSVAEVAWLLPHLFSNLEMRRLAIRLSPPLNMYLSFTPEHISGVVFALRAIALLGAQGISLMQIVEHAAELRRSSPNNALIDWVTCPKRERQCVDKRLLHLTTCSDSILVTELGGVYETLHR